MVVLRGAKNLPATRKRRIVFESWPGSARQDVFSLLSNDGYRTRALALRDDVTDGIEEVRYYTSLPSLDDSPTSLDTNRSGSSDLHQTASRSIPQEPPAGTVVLASIKSPANARVLGFPRYSTIRSARTKSGSSCIDRSA